MSFITQAKGLFARTRKAPELSTSVVEHDAIDDYVHGDLLGQAEHYREVMTRTHMERDGETADFDWWPDTCADVFNAQHNVNPFTVMRDSEQVRPSHRLGHEIVGHYTDTEDHLKSKPHTRLDRTTSGVVSMAAAQTLADELLNGALKDQAEEAQRALEQENAMTAAQEALDHLREQAAEQGFASDEQKGEMKVAAEAKADARRALGEIVERMDAGAVALDEAAIAAVAKASAEGNEMAQVWTSVAGTLPGDKRSISPDKALELALRWKDGDVMQRIALKCGRITRDMRGERRRNIRGGRDERIGIKTGNDLSLLVPSQLVRLAKPELRPAFFKNYTDRSLLIYDTQSDEDAGRGPVVILVDVSGTMGGRKAERNEWAKAVMMALIALAQRDSRAAYVIAFDSQVQGEWEFTKPDLEKLTDAACFFTGGGTNIHAALTAGARFIERHDKFAKADMVLITDGVSDWKGATDALRDSLREKGVMTHGVSIGMPIAGNVWMTDFCDTAVEVTDLDGPNDATRHLALATV